MSFTIRPLKEEKPKRTLPWKRAAVLGAKIGAPLLGGLALFWRHRQREAQQKYRVLTLKRVLLVLIATLCALLLLAGVVRGMIALRVITLDSVVATAGSPPPADANGHINILLLGQGDATHDGKDLTDTIMVANIDPETSKSVVLLSLPRDLYFLKTEKMGKGRLNSMYRDYKNYLRYQQGMPEEDAIQAAIGEVATEVGRKLNLEIHHAVKVDFKGFVELVDALEGVTVNVPQDIIDTEYPDDNYGFETFTLNAGEQHLDGATALKYARSRHSTSDFSRSARQQQLLQAMADKAESQGMLKNPTTIAEVVRILTQHVTTTLSLRELVGLAEIGKQIDRTKIVAMQINDRNGLYDSPVEPGGLLYTPPRHFFDGASVLLPVSVPEFPITWRQLQTLTQLLTKQREHYLHKPQLSILNAGARSGSARRLANELTRYGFPVVNVANASSADQPISTVSAPIDAYKPQAAFFSQLLGVADNPLPAGLPADEISQVTIIVGENYTYTPLQDLIANTP